MASSSPSTPSEGEIVESDTEKAKPSINSLYDTSVDRRSRNRASISRSPSPLPSPRQYRSRTRSRSPYREPRGAKRAHVESHNNVTHNDARRFAIHYEDRPSKNPRRTYDRYENMDRRGLHNGSTYRDDRSTSGRSRGNRQRNRSRSPKLQSCPHNHGGLSNAKRSNHTSNQSIADRSLPSQQEHNSRLCNEDSVSDSGRHTIPSRQKRQEAEPAGNRAECESASALFANINTSVYVRPRDY